MSGSATLSALGLAPGVAGLGLALLFGSGLMVWTWVSVWPVSVASWRWSSAAMK